MSQSTDRNGGRAWLRRFGAAAAVTAGLFATGLSMPAAMAQPTNTPAKKEKEYKPPTPLPPTNPPSQPAQMAVAVAILCLLLAASLIPSKRGHQD